MDQRAVILGAAGFIGSHLCDRFLAEGWRVTGIDSLITGSLRNLEHLRREPRFDFVEGDICDRIEIAGRVNAVLDFASPASPIDYLQHPLETLHVGSLGVENALLLAKEKGARFLLSSTSEVYGDPLEHPQRESYWGNVNPIGPRAVYDEAKRFAEALTLAYHRDQGLETRIVRIFNTMGERMRTDDGRAIPTFIAQALNGEPMTVHGDGSQTRSVGYVVDLVEGVWRLLRSDVADPVNIGNPEEHTVLELAHAVAEAAGIEPEIRFVDRPVDDPSQRRPDITRARDLLGWEPRISLQEGLGRTAAWFRAMR